MAHFATKFVSSYRWVGAMVLLLALSPNAGWGSLTWESQRIELTAKAGENQVAVGFRFKNSGQAPVTIVSIQPSCGCTTAELAKRTFTPGETDEIKAVYTFGDIVGHQEKTIQVVTDDAPSQPVVLVLRVNVQELFTCAPRLLLWRIGGEPVEKSVMISPVDPQKLKSVEIKSLAPTEVSIRVESLDNGNKYRLLIRPISTAKEFQVSLTGAVFFTDGSTRPFTVFALIK
jgi:hypothetical protein